MLTGRPSSSSTAAITPRSGLRADAAALTAPPRGRLRSTSTRGGSALCQDVTVASRYRVSRSRGVLSATQSSAASRNASWLSSPASAWWRTAGYRRPRLRHQLVPAVPRPRLFDRDPSAVGGDPDHVGPPGARLGEHLERELLVVGPVAPGDEPSCRTTTATTIARRPTTLAFERTRLR